VLWEILALDVGEELFLDFWLGLLMLETDKLQSCLTTI
jgi:hypothetical protein